jgi:predicted nucleic acid-binding protein
VAALTVFLDANVLFSAALGGPAFELLWELERRGRIRFVTSRQCRAEASTNLERKRPDAGPRLAVLLSSVDEAPEPEDVELQRARQLLPEKDAPVMAAALAARASVLVTGDLKHFGSLMARRDLKLRIRTPREFLLEGR